MSRVVSGHTCSTCRFWFELAGTSGKGDRAVNEVCDNCGSPSVVVRSREGRFCTSECAARTFWRISSPCRRMRFSHVLPPASGHERVIRPSSRPITTVRNASGTFGVAFAHPSTHATHWCGEYVGMFQP